MPSKRLIIRLSSLGDVILASSALSVTLSSKDSAGLQDFDWLVLQDYQNLLQGHPRLQRVIGVQRSMSLKSWVQICRKIWDMPYLEIYDLHRSLRTLLMRLLFKFWTLTGRRPSPIWKSVSKQRIRLYGYLLFKAKWPKAWRPVPWVTRFSKAVGGKGHERPDLRHLLAPYRNPVTGGSVQKFLENARAQTAGYLCIMPSSRWAGKQWSVDSYVRLIRQLPYYPVILGSAQDANSEKLVRELRILNLDHHSGVGQWNLMETAQILSQSVGYLGSDTGLAHLAESLGVSARVIFGPTSSEMGFGPWKSESGAIEIPMACRPCGKEGRRCYRITQKYSCLTGVSPEKVLQSW